ncbi:FG-GAP repeat domain-containing protein [Streptomyces sp. CB03234]|uniref:FG-GAP repeat domain-containing protein n=1 Tax=Streptomyces sp. (strain CB03234) TaxID=1703937 RepID=UPI00093D9AC5|nr:VCBS repeat-containing protein [Streptomyces sp. CB03234]
MSRHAIVRATLVAGLVIGTVAPLGGAAVAAEPAPLPAHTVIDNDRYTPRSTGLYSVGPHGVLRSQEGTSGYLWTSLADGRSTPVPGLDTYIGGSSGSDVIGIGNGSSVELRNLADGTSRTLTLPADHTYLGTYGDTVLTRTSSATDLYLHRLGDDGGTVTRQVEADAGIVLSAHRYASDARTVVLNVKDSAGSDRLGLLDVGTGRLTTGPKVTSYTHGHVVSLGHDRLAWRDDLSATIKVVPRSAPLSAPVTLPAPSTDDLSLGMLGDWVVVAGRVRTDDGYRGGSLTALPLDGGQAVPLLEHAVPALRQVPGGGLLAVGGTDSSHWAVHRVTAGENGGAPTVGALADVPPMPSSISRLSMANGLLATKETSADRNYPTYYTRSVTTDGARLVPGRNVFRSDSFRTGVEGPHATGEGRAVLTAEAADGTSWGVNAFLEPGEFTAGYQAPATKARLVEITGRYAVVNGTDTGKQYIGDLSPTVYGRNTLRTQAITATTVWGRLVWSQTTTAGQLKVDNLVTGAHSTFSTGAPCRATELQAVGRWLYWSCGASGPAGVYDRTARKSIPVPSGEALIGDGYLVRHDKAAGKLLLTEFRDGVADTTQTVGDLPATTAPQRGVTWTVDRFGGPVAYVAADGKIHLAPSGVPTDPLALVDTYLFDPYRYELRLRLQLSRPTSSWRLQFRHTATGRVFHTVTGTDHNGLVKLTWDGRTADGYAPNGAYTWELTAQPANGQGPALSTSGPLMLDTGAAVWRDHSSTGTTPETSLTVDGRPDLLSLGSGGDIAVHAANGTGGYSRTTSVTGWPTNALVVPMGDMDGNRCSDVLVRLGNELRRYHGSCHGYLNPKHPYTSLGTVWGQFNVLTSPGDLTGDGRPDLVARQATTGDVYLYADNGAGGLKPRGRIGTGWKGYRAIFGAGDLNGDGLGDLLAVDGANSLWRYDSTATGTLKPRALVFGTNWATGRNAFVGAGDVTGDGRPDLITRNTAGDLLRNNGNGKGSFGSTVKIGTGWQSKLRLF